MCDGTTWAITHKMMDTELIWLKWAPFVLGSQMNELSSHLSALLQACHGIPGPQPSGAVDRDLLQSNL